MVEKQAKKQEKLSYEELERTSQLISAQADGLAKENRQLKEALRNAQMGVMFTQLQFKFEVLKYADQFTPEFVESIVKQIEETMSPEENIEDVVEEGADEEE